MHDLMTHADWVSGLARQLVANASLADDVGQDAWVAAVERPPSRATNVRSWLAEVVRNKARQSGRADSRRRARERSTARAEATPSTLELVERAGLQRDVVSHVLALDAPFREVVLLRYFEDLPPRDIASRLGVPVKTVNSRLQRANAKLRERLDREYGDRATWCAALMPLCAMRESVAVVGTTSLLSVTGGLLMNLNAKLVVPLSIALIGGLGLWRALSSGPDAAEAAPERAAALAPQQSPELHNPTVLASEVGAERSLDEVASVEPDKAVQDAVPNLQLEMARLRGRVVDPKGRPVTRIQVALGSGAGAPTALVDSDGTFELEYAPAKLVFLKKFASSASCMRVVGDEYLTIMESCVTPANMDMEHIVVAALTHSLSGRVVDRAAVGVAGARVFLSRHGGPLVDFPYPLDMASLVNYESRSGSDGTFEFERFPVASGLKLSVEAKGFESAQFELDSMQAPFVFELTRIEDSDRDFVEGIVLDSQGFPVEDARVKLADAETRSDQTGHFRMPIDNVAATTPLCAAKPGSLPALISDFGELLERTDRAPGPVELVLGGAPLEIEGRVVDSEGKGLRGWHVAVLDETEISQYRVPAVTAEGFARKENGEIKTNGRGEFLIKGLFPRDYKLWAYNEDSLFRVEGVARAGDRDVELLAEMRSISELRGRVISRDGDPMPNIEVNVSLVTSKTSVGSTSVSGSKVVTDEDGEFVFHDVPAEHIHIGYGGESILPGRRTFDDKGVTNDLEIEVVRRCHFRVEPADVSLPAQRVVLYDADGKSLQVNKFSANGMCGYSWMPLENGRSEVLSTAETAVTAVVHRDGVEVARESIRLVPNEVTVLRL